MVGMIPGAQPFAPLLGIMGQALSAQPQNKSNVVSASPGGYGKGGVITKGPEKGKSFMQLSGTTYYDPYYDRVLERSPKGYYYAPFQENYWRNESGTMTLDKINQHILWDHKEDPTTMTDLKDPLNRFPKPSKAMEEFNQEKMNKPKSTTRSKPEMAKGPKPQMAKGPNQNVLEFQKKYNAYLTTLGSTDLLKEDGIEGKMTRAAKAKWESAVARGGRVNKATDNLEQDPMQALEGANELQDNSLTKLALGGQLLDYLYNYQGPQNPVQGVPTQGVPAQPPRAYNNDQYDFEGDETRPYMKVRNSVYYSPGTDELLYRNNITGQYNAKHLRGIENPYKEAGDKLSPEAINNHIRKTYKDPVTPKQSCQLYQKGRRCLTYSQI
jgi:hypothetical protein